MWLTTHTGDPFRAMVAMGIGNFSMDLSMPIAWIACMEHARGIREGSPPESQV